MIPEDDYVTRMLLCAVALVVASIIFITLYFHHPELPFLTNHLSSDPSSIVEHGDPP